MADDWGCFNADTDIIKGLVYPKRNKITLKKIETLKTEYYEAGKLFIWNENERVWGFFSAWDGHQFCNATHLNDDGKQARHKRKTPTPPKKELELFIDGYLHKKQEAILKLEQVRASADKYRIPIPNPIPNPIPKKKGKDFSLPSWIPREEWDGFVEMREQIKAPLTDRAKELAIKALAKFKVQGYEAGAILNQSVMNGWKGLFSLKDGGSNGKRNKVGGVRADTDKYDGVTIHPTED